MQAILKNRDIAEGILTRHSDSTEYKSIFDGNLYKNNLFYSGEETRLSIILYVDDFEVCNPLGTLRKKTQNNGRLLAFGKVAICIDVHKLGFTL